MLTSEYVAHQQQPRFQPRAQLPMVTRIDTMPKNGEALQYVLALNPSQADTALRAGLVYRGSYDPAKAAGYGLSPVVNEQLPVAVFSEALDGSEKAIANILLLAHPDIDKQSVNFAEAGLTFVGPLGAVGDPYGGLLAVWEISDGSRGLSQNNFIAVHDAYTSLYELYESQDEYFSELHGGMPGLMQRAREQLSLHNSNALASVDFGSAAMVKLVTQQIVERPYRHGGQYDLALQELSELAQFAGLLDENYCVITFDTKDVSNESALLSDLEEHAAEVQTNSTASGPTQLNLFNPEPEHQKEFAPNKPKAKGPRM